MNIASLGFVRAPGNEREVDSESSVVKVAQDKTLDKEQRWGQGQLQVSVLGFKAKAAGVLGRPH